VESDEGGEIDSDEYREVQSRIRVRTMAEDTTRDASRSREWTLSRSPNE
jgi:hypothetical protein